MLIVSGALWVVMMVLGILCVRVVLLVADPPPASEWKHTGAKVGKSSAGRVGGFV